MAFAESKADNNRAILPWAAWHNEFVINYNI